MPGELWEQILEAADTVTKREEAFQPTGTLWLLPSWCQAETPSCSGWCVWTSCVLRAQLTVGLLGGTWDLVSDKWADDGSCDLWLRTQVSCPRGLKSSWEWTFESMPVGYR